MELQDQQSIAASRHRVFEALNDPEILRQCIPGCETLTKRSDHEMDATVSMKVGPIKAKFNGSVTLNNLNPPEGYSITGEGSGGGAGFAKGGADVCLIEDGPSTILQYNVKVDVGGKLASLGARLIESVAKKLSGEFFEKFATLVESANQESASAFISEETANAETGIVADRFSRTYICIAAGVIAVALAAIWLAMR
ncbi:MAG: carbon monoxide dehydrogenase [Alphaproteobacteria bacterium]|nr:carbon monoxide dehydrogenase [Alphaproteobacteria bacterium]